MKSEIKAGRWIRVQYDDVGARDVILLKKEKTKYGYHYTVYEPYSNGTSCLTDPKIIGVGNYINAKDANIE